MASTEAKYSVFTNKRRIVGTTPTGSLIHQDIAIMGPVSQIVDDQNLMRNPTENSLVTLLNLIMVDYHRAPVLVYRDNLVRIEWCLELNRRKTRRREGGNCLECFGATGESDEGAALSQRVSES